MFNQPRVVTKRKCSFPCKWGSTDLMATNSGLLFRRKLIGFRFEYWSFNLIGLWCSGYSATRPAAASPAQPTQEPSKSRCKSHRWSVASVTRPRRGLMRINGLIKEWQPSGKVMNNPSYQLVSSHVPSTTSLQSRNRPINKWNTTNDLLNRLAET